MLIKKLRDVCKNLIDEVEVNKGIGVCDVPEQIANILFDGYSIVEKRLFIKGCFSPEARKIYEANGESAITDYWKS